MFYHNFKGYLAEKIAERLDEDGSAGYWVLSQDMLWTQALDIVNDKIGAKGELDFGGIVALALHDYDNQNVVEVVSEGNDKKLYGDGNAGKGDEMALASRAVKLSVEDIERAYALGKAGKSTADELLGDDDLFAAERVIPTVATGPGKNKSNPGMDYRKASAEDLLTDPYFQNAVFVFCKEKASEVQKLADEMGGAKKRALEKAVIGRLSDKNQCVNLIWEVINWVPDTGGGAFGQNTDENASDYYDAAAAKAGGLESLTYVQRANLINPMMGGWKVWDSEEERIWSLLDTASDADARKVIRHVGWERIADALEGAEDDKFRAKFPKATYDRR
jgi:hypothetical protein